MKIRCEKEHLLTAVQIVQKATASKTTMPILTGIYLNATENSIELQATDYEIGISVIIPAEVILPGKVVLSGKFFPEIIRKISGKTVEIESISQSNMVNVSCQKTEFRVLSFPADEYPNIKRFESNNFFIIKDDILKDLIKKTVFSCSSDESRPLFTGALIELHGEEINFVATNTHRLAYKKHELILGDISAKMIIPGKILTEISKIMTYELPIDVKVCWSKNQVSFSFENIYISSRLIEGKFPDYRKVIPSDFISFCIVEAEKLFDAVERVALLAKDGEYNIVKVKFNNNIIELAGNNPDAGSATESIDVIVEGEPIEISFNAKYLLDILRIAGSGKVKFNLKSGLSPVMINLIDDKEYTYIITPIRTN